ncbi:MAG: FAD/NAD(P)-binding protein [Pseudomonadota bacterium]
MKLASHRAGHEHIAVVGAGFSGSLQAINLLRHDGPRTTLVERRSTAGRGVAYSTAHPGHLLNVRAANMSALPDDPDHFLRWLADRHPEQDGFVPRTLYGDYLGDLLSDTLAASPDRLALHQAEVVDVVPVAGDGFDLLFDEGDRLRADAVILAPGNLPPHQPTPLAAADLPSAVYAGDPWAADATTGLSPDDTILIIGTGLTMVDMVLLLEAGGHRGRIVAMSRRGLSPHAHADGVMAAPLNERPPVHPTGALSAVRRRATHVGWRAAVDALRPFTQSMWLAADADQRRRFLRHLRPWWDIHRHRLAPAVAARIAAMRRSGQLEIVAGKLQGAVANGTGAIVDWRPRGEDAIRSLDVARIINCSGPQGDLRKTDDRLLRNLVARGLIRPDPLQLGIDVNARSEAIAEDGRPNPGLMIIGPMTRSAFWEIVAVPDIRVQTWALARRLCNAQWVEGEGL